MKLRILLVDDEDTILVTTRAILELSGYEVETAVSAADAQAKLMSETFDMVLTDMKMETNTAGFDVVRVARSRAIQRSRSSLPTRTSVPIGNVKAPMPSSSSRWTPTIWFGI